MESGEALAAAYRRTRARTEELCGGLELEDFVVQPIDDVSPPKWHLGHTTWFFETFVLAPRGRAPRAELAAVFNSYYRALGDPYPRSKRGTRSRPTVREVAAYRREIDEEVERLLARPGGDGEARTESALILGLQHEQQHQELLTADIKLILAHNGASPPRDARPAAGPPRRVALDGGLFRLGHGGDGFSFDNERPAHDALVGPFRLSSRLVTRGEYGEFIRDGGYQDFRHWLSDGWDRVVAERWSAPLHWELGGGPEEPALHLSYYEADAFARWAGARLPTEAEWEFAAARAEEGALEQLFGEAWQWTSSAYGPYPGFKPLAGAFGEYNGKFMSGQFVLRGSSPATPAGHERLTYRNFFQPEKRWQFTGVRLAWDS